MSSSRQAWCPVIAHPLQLCLSVLATLAASLELRRDLAFALRRSHSLPGGHLLNPLERRPRVRARRHPGRVERRYKLFKPAGDLCSEPGAVHCHERLLRVMRGLSTSDLGTAELVFDEDRAEAFHRGQNAGRIQV